jgi:hypothetical protein
MEIDKRRVWVSNGPQSPVVCFGYSLDHFVLSPSRAREIGESLIRAADECLREEATNEGS